MKIVQPELVLVSVNPDYSVPSNAIVYADLSPDETQIILTVNADAILISLHNLFSTEKGERLNLPEYGLDLDDQLFELMDEATRDQILTEVYTEVIAWEPRVEMIYSMCRIEEDPDDHWYKVTLVFRLAGLENTLLKYRGILVKSRAIFGDMYQSD